MSDNVLMYTLHCKNSQTKVEINLWIYCIVLCCIKKHSAISPEKHIVKTMHCDNIIILTYCDKVCECGHCMISQNKKRGVIITH